ncbi:MAG: alanine--tRNA ligase [Patescibacteria group bacterium]
MTTNQLRQKYLDFYKTRGHAIVPSASLLPENDPTTLFTGSGMQPMIPFLLGEKHPLGTRVADSQKCFRSQDIDEVGDNRHTTFFEMLGNWSLGDYFKQEQIPWIWEFLTKEVGLDPKRLYVTCFRGNEGLGIPRDTESAELWQKLFSDARADALIADFSERDGLQNGRIFYYDEKKNWWSRSGTPDKMPIGEPGGPDTEMFWDYGLELGLHEKSKWKNQPCHVNCDCGRFLEIGNSVFMEYRKTKSGFEKLKQRNVDFGGGLERIAAALQDDPDVFKIDLFEGMRHELEVISRKPYGVNAEETYAYRVILDHIRAATFLIADGVPPANKDQGYFTRLLMRRSIRFAQKLGITQNFCAKVSEQVIEKYKDAYPELVKHRELIASIMNEEEQKFARTIRGGLQLFNELLKGRERKIIGGKEAFDLYQSYGFPLEMTEELATEHGFSVDRTGFEQELKVHQDVSRMGSEKKFKGGLADHSDMSVKYHTATHLLHAALRKVLGPQAEQRGSNITPERLRFDFAHPTKMTPEEIKATEDLVNAAIQRDYPMTWQELPLAEAKRLQAIGLFEEKYGDKVKVYTVGDPAGMPVADPSAKTFSREFCGGPHVEHTGVIGKFKIVKEEACSAGVRRIKAIVI